MTLNDGHWKKEKFRQIITKDEWEKFDDRWICCDGKMRHLISISNPTNFGATLEIFKEPI